MSNAAASHPPETGGPGEEAALVVLDRFQRLAPLLGLFLFCLSLWGLHHLLAEHHLKDLLRELESIPASRLCLAGAVTVLSYLVLTLYDHLALRYIGRPLPYRVVALTSFITYTFSHNLGLGGLSGGSVRMRFYSAQGLGAVEIARLIVFAGTVLWSGCLLLAGWALVAAPVAPWMPAWPLWTYRSLGIALLVCVAVFLAASFLRKGPLRIGRWELPMPAPSLALQMVGVSVVDWGLAAAALYALIPHGPDSAFLPFLLSFLLAQLAGVLSHVPGGVGVFDTAMLLSLSSTVPAPIAGGVLIAYRVVYYLIPFLFSILLLGSHELLEHRVRVGKALGAAGRWLSPFVPPAASAAVFLAGTALTLSGAVPPHPGRLSRAGEAYPLAIIELSHFSASVIGTALLVLAHGLWRRVSAAHALACGLLLLGGIASVLKGDHSGQAWSLAAVLGFLFVSRREFFRKATLSQEPFSLEWNVLTAAVFLCTLWLGMFSYKHLPYSDDLWWSFSLHAGSASRFLRAGAGSAVTILLFSVTRLLRPAPPEPPPADPQDIVRASPLVGRCPRTCANLVFLGDKSLLWSKTGDAFLMWAAEGRSWVAMSDPVGAEQSWPDLIWDFKDMADRQGARAAFYQIAPEKLHLYADAGFSMLKLGEEALVPLENFTLQGGAYKTLRQAVNKLEEANLQFDIRSPEEAAARMAELKAVSDAWMAGKNTREKGFSLGSFDESYLKRFPIVTVCREGTVLAFANLLIGADKAELSVDLMRHRPEAPPGLMDYLFARLMLWGKAQGYRRFNLGMAPLAGLAARTSSPLWNRIGGLVFRHGEHFYNFQGLRHYKEKFKPEWEPRYLAYADRMALPTILLDLSTLISGGFKGMLAK